MTNNKKSKKKKVKKEIIYRTKEERQKEVKTILEQLSGFDLDSLYSRRKENSCKYTISRNKKENKRSSSNICK